ncbi:MAG: 50S ribosomal protein L16 [Candidatus Pacearchaeota archaeon]
MPVRKALAYSKKYTRPYTRKSSVKSKSYIKTIPPQKIVKMRMGNVKAYENNEFKYVIRLLSNENVQIRDLALEASRQYINKMLDTELPGQYFFELRVYPHHIIREHKVLTGAGADRMAVGMAHSFGVTIGRAALVKEGEEIFLVAVPTEKAMRLAIQFLKQVKSKLPCNCSISVEIKK